MSIASQSARTSLTSASILTIHTRPGSASDSIHLHSLSSSPKIHQVEGFFKSSNEISAQETSLNKSYEKPLRTKASHNYYPNTEKQVVVQDTGRIQSERLS